MTEQELREKVWDVLHKHYYPTMHEAIVDCSLISCAYEILALIKEAGYVKLADDQSWPNYLGAWNECCVDGIRHLKEEMLKVGWRKAEVDNV